MKELKKQIKDIVKGKVVEISLDPYNDSRENVIFEENIDLIVSQIVDILPLHYVMQRALIWWGGLSFEGKMLFYNEHKTDIKFPKYKGEPLKSLEVIEYLYKYYGK